MADAVSALPFTTEFQVKPDQTGVIDLFHKWRLLHGNEARILFIRSILVSNCQTAMISFFAFFLLSLGLVLKVSFRVRFRIWISLLFSDFSKDQT